MTHHSRVGRHCTVGCTYTPHTHAPRSTKSLFFPPYIMYFLDLFERRIGLLGFVVFLGGKGVS